MSFVPPLQQVIIQKNYLERRFQDSLVPLIGFNALAESDPIEARVGESKTLTRDALLPPITNDVVPSPTVFTDLNNGITPQATVYEQYVTTIAKRRGMMTLDLELEELIIAPQFLRNWDKLTKQAVESRDIRAAGTLFTAYDGGNTYVTAAAVTTGPNQAVPVDNASGFDTSYAAALAAGSAPGVPQPVSGSNPLAVTIVSQQAGTMGTMTNALCINVAFDPVNVSSAYTPSTPYGRSGIITLAPVVGTTPVTIAAGDVVKAVDGAVVLRPNGKLTRGQLASTDVATLSLLTKAKGRLVARAVPFLPGTNHYACMIDPLLWSDLENDTAFQRATAGGFETGGFFRTGKVSAALGLEFIETSFNPVYQIPGQAANGVVARHALVVGGGALVKSPSIGFERAADQARTANTARDESGRVNATDVRLIDGIKMVTRQPLDPEATVITQTWSWATGHVTATDITSTPNIIPQTDNARYKRAVLVEFASTF